METSQHTHAIIDGHVHFAHPERMDVFLPMLEESRASRYHLVCVPELDGRTHNPAALFFKRRLPEQTYISGALEYIPVLNEPERAAEILAAQVSALKAQGFDGLKLIEGKPQVRKLLPYRLDGPVYAGMWAELERLDFPVTFHVGDPDYFWDPVACPDWATQAGWNYSDGTYPSKEDLYQEVDAILTRHPDLRITFAHLYFLSGDLERAGRFLDAHPGVCFDLTPHMDMYLDFSRTPDSAREFFLRFQDRIIYGTDLDTRSLSRGPQSAAFLRSIPVVIQSMLERSGVYTLENGVTYHGLGLPGPVLDKIYRANFERIYGERPTALSG